jgi:two-component system, NarL family, response regulator DesR
MIRVLLADDQAMVRGAIAALLAMEKDIEIVAEASRGNEVLSRAVSGRVDVALLDIEMPGGDGLSAASVLREGLPSCRVVMLTTFGRPGYLKQAMDNGAVGFLTKDAPASQLASAIRRVAAGERVIDPQLAIEALSDGENPLTARERDVLAASAGGASIAQVADKLFLSAGTVRNYLSMAIQKLGARNRIEACRIAREKGWL